MSAATGCCREGSLEHCHAPYVEHADGGECADPLCRLPAEAHPDVVACAGVVPACGCGDERAPGTDRTSAGRDDAGDA